jgi:hypothetical protein
MDLINPVVGGDVKPNTGHHENKYSPLALIHQTQTLHHNTPHNTTKQHTTININNNTRHKTRTNEEMKK